MSVTSQKGQSGAKSQSSFEQDNKKFRLKGNGKLKANCCYFSVHSKALKVYIYMYTIKLKTNKTDLHDKSETLRNSDHVSYGGPLPLYRYLDRHSTKYRSSIDHVAVDGRLIYQLSIDRLSYRSI
mgnify:CR=1 FL=1